MRNNESEFRYLFKKKILSGLITSDSFFVRLRNLSNQNDYAITLFSRSNTGSSICDDGVTTLASVYENVSTTYQWTVPTASFPFNHAFLVIDDVEETVSSSTALTTSDLLTALNALGYGTFTHYTDGSNEVFYVASLVNVFGDLSTLSSDRTLWITDSGTVYNVSTIGIIASSFAATVYGGTAPTGVCVALDGTLWVTDGNNIYNIQTDGTLISSFVSPTAIAPTGIGYGLDDTLWITGGNTIYNVQTDGTAISNFAATVYGGAAPTGICEALDSTLWITDGNTIYNVQTDGTLISSFVGQVGGALPTGIGYELDDTLWVTAGANVYNIQTDGTPISNFAAAVYGGALPTCVSSNINNIVSVFTPVVTTQTISGTEVEITGSSAINDLNNSVIGNKFKIKCLDLQLFTSNTDQIRSPICCTKKDSNGKLFNYKVFPLYDPYQSQNIVECIDVKDIVLDGINNITYTVLAGQEIRIEFHYDKLSTADLTGLKFVFNHFDVKHIDEKVLIETIEEGKKKYKIPKVIKEQQVIKIKGKFARRAEEVIKWYEEQFKLQEDGVITEQDEWFEELYDWGCYNDRNKGLINFNKWKRNILKEFDNAKNKPE